MSYQPASPIVSDLLPLTEGARDFLECTSDCVLILDEDWRFTYLNHRAREEVDPQGRGLIGKSIWTAFPDTLGTAFEDHYRHAMERREEVNFDWFMESLATWYEVRASPLTGGGIGVWFRSINERKEWVATLTAAEERFRLAAKATQDLIFDLDISSGRIDWQEAESQFFGYRHDELGPDVRWLFERIHPDDREYLKARALAAVKGPDDRFVCDFRIARSDGSYAEVLTRGFLMRDAAGRTQRMVGAVQDNSERYASARALHDREAHLSTVFGQAMVGIMHSDPSGQLLMINDRFCEILGRTKEELHRLTFADYTHPDDLSWNVPLHAAKKDAGEPFQIEKRYLRPDGSVAWCEVSISYVTADDGSIASTIAVAQDITARKVAEEALTMQSTLLQTVIDSVQDLIFVKDKKGQFVLANRALIDGCGDLMVSDYDDSFSHELIDEYEAIDREVIETGQPRTVEEPIPIRGANRMFETVKVPWVDQGEIAGVIGVARDITDNKIAENTLRESEQLYRTVLEASTDCIEVIDLAGNVTLANSPALQALNCEDQSEVVGRPWVSFWPPENRQKLESALDAARCGEVVRFSTESQLRSESSRWWDVVVSPMSDEDGAVTGILSIARDTTLQRETSAKLKWASEHDELTALPNRRAFQTRLQATTIRAMETGDEVGLLLIDLDHFKHVNDTLGHTAGDHVLRILGQRLQGTLSGSDFLSRLGGDEFAVVLQAEKGTLDLAATGARLLACLQQPVQFGGRTLSASASLGGAIFPRDARTANELLDNADIALYALKGTGRGGTRMFEPYMRDRAQIVSAQLSLARASISEETVEAFYQPKVVIETGEIVGFEALLRWRHSSRGIQVPGSVEEAFRDFELATRISDLMQHCVFRNMREWMNRGLPFGRVSINAAPVEFLRDDFAERMIARIDEYNIPPERIELEVTEHVFLERGSNYVGRALKHLNDLGIKIALDDFGTGYSSLSHLRDFPVDVVKIDRSFVAGMTKDTELLSIVSAIIDLAKNLKISVVAEGVETKIERALLLERGCPFGQGYLFGRAIPSQDVPALF